MRQRFTGKTIFLTENTERLSVVFVLFRFLYRRVPFHVNPIPPHRRCRCRRCRRRRFSRACVCHVRKYIARRMHIVLTRFQLICVQR